MILHATHDITLLSELSLVSNLMYCFLQVDPVTAGVQFDKEFVVCSLDLLSGLTEGLGSGIESLVFSFLYNLSKYISPIHKM